ncbi:MAG: NAD(P)H-dependent oxidoreductase subunit E [Clostridia bacterium]|nr:NAD(P)H-dependent oxidoreductase subunit E [Clostridia bacterium]
MAKKLSQEECFAKLNEAIEVHKGSQGALMPILHEAQHLFGAVPLDVQKVISKALSIPLAEIYGVVTFYSQFTLEPNGEFLIGVCMGTACYVKGSGPILDRISRELNLPVKTTSQDGKFTLIDTRCIGACGLAPVITINDDVYGRLTEAEIPSILAKYINA